jgi:hypothetical protein
MNDLKLDGGGWRNYPDLNTESLWQISRRDSSGLHKGDYHGNFVPQIAKEFILRYTKEGDTVLDCFAGSGTALMEAKRMGRNAIGWDINDAALEMSRERVAGTSGTGVVQLKKQDCLGRGCTGWVTGALAKAYRQVFNLAFLHPPYHDIIKFNEDDEQCLSNAPGIEAFYAQMKHLAGLVWEMLVPGGHAVLVIGDKYTKGRLVPMGFETYQQFAEVGFVLKAVVVKDMQGNELKGKNKNLWRYRHLKHGTFEFKHEYIFLISRPKKGKK